MFHPSAYENARPDGFGVLEVVGDGDAGQARRFVPLRRTELRGEVVGPLAALRLTQSSATPQPSATGCWRPPTASPCPATPPSPASASASATSRSAPS